MPVSNHKPPAGVVRRYYENKGNTARADSLNKKISERAALNSEKMCKRREQRIRAMKAGACKPLGE